MQKRNCHKLASAETMTKFIHASQTQALEMSRSTKSVMRSELVM